MPLHILGINHNTAPVELREQVVFSELDIERALSQIAALPGIQEVLILSTCNRTEILVVQDNGGAAALKDWLGHAHGLDKRVLGALFALDGSNAALHLFRVACGLDSMVLGETQILGQLKEAFRTAQQAGTTGRQLHRLLQHSFSVAKKVRTDTNIGASPVSVASAAVSLARQFFARFDRHTALLVGAGATIELVAQHLSSQSIGRLFVTNRNLDKAKGLASQFGGYAVPLSELEGTLPEADILISSTASPTPVITLPQMTRAISDRRRRPMFALDIAVPRDIDPAVSSLDDVYLYTVDDLHAVVTEGQNNREAAAIEAGLILDEELHRYLGDERRQEAVPVIRALHAQSDDLRRMVLDEAKRRLRSGKDAEEVMEYLANSLTKKLLHMPSSRLRAAGEAANKEFIESARHLFDLNED